MGAEAAVLLPDGQEVTIDGDGHVRHFLRRLGSKKNKRDREKQRLQDAKELAKYEAKLAEITLDHWAWNICGGDGFGERAFAFRSNECADQVDVPDGYYFQAGTLGGPAHPGRRECDAPGGKKALIPIINSIAFVAPDEKVKDWVKYLDECYDSAVVTLARVNGKKVPVHRLKATTDNFVAPCLPDAKELIGEASSGAPVAADGLWVEIELEDDEVYVIELGAHQTECNKYGLEYSLVLTT
jgi:hypothetical protein